VLADAIVFLIATACGLLAIALLLRFYLQWARAGYRNPVSQFINALTDFMVRPARRVIPGLWGLDLASPILAWLIQYVELILITRIKGAGTGLSAGAALAPLALLAAIMVVKLGLYMVMIVVILQALLSWVNPYSPLTPLLNALARPFLRVFQQRIPPVGNVDLSPLFVIVACQLLLMLPVAYLEAWLLRTP
jgi:YggT family protein